MPLPNPYTTGTVSVSNEGTTVTGSGAIWSDIKAGDTLSIAGMQTTIIEVVDTTHLTIEPWPWGDQTGAAYKIIKDSPLRFAGSDAMAAVVEINEALSRVGYIYPVDGSAPDPSWGHDGNLALKTNATPWTLWKKVSGAWVQQNSGSTLPIETMGAANLIVNGGMEVSQENGTSSVSFASGSVSKYVVDQVSVSKSGTSVFAVQQVASVFPGYEKEIKFTVSTAQASMGSDGAVIHFPIEGYTAARLGWGTSAAQPLSVGFWVKSSVSGTLGLSAQNADFSISDFQSNSVTAGVAKFVKYTFSAKTTGTWNKGNGVGVYLALTIADATNINIVSSTSNTFEMTGLVALPGIELPASDRAQLLMRPYSQELLLCRRYYENNILVGFYSGETPNDKTTSQTIKLDPKRATPTISFSGGSPTNVASEAANEISAFGFRYSLTSSNDQVGYPGRRATADARF